MPLSQQQAYNAEAEQRRRERANRNRRSGPSTQEDYNANAGLAGLPGAFAGENGFSAGSGAGHKRRPSVGDGSGVGPEEYYQSGNNGDRYQPERQRLPLNVDTDLSRSNTRGEQERGIRRGSVTARRDPEITVSGESSRRPSGASAKNRNASLVTSEKSPLQHLEISLKEEKRLRAQEAERQAKERRAAAESGNLAAPLQHPGPRVPAKEPVEDKGKAVHFRNRPVAIGKVEPQAAESIPAGDNFASRDRRRQEQGDPVQEREILEAQPSTRRLTKEPPPPARNFRPDDELPPPSPHYVPNPAIPKRSNSFRERAASLIKGGAAGAAAAVGLERRDSNKLKKNPPGDPWRLSREAFEDQSKAQMEAKAMADEKKRQRQALYYGGGPLGSSPVDGDIRHQQEAGLDGPAQARHRRTDTLASEDHPYEIEENLRGMPKRTNSAKKAEQLLGAGFGRTQLDNNPPFPLPKKDPIRRAITPQEQQLYADRLDRSEEIGPDWGEQTGQRGDYTMTGANNRPALGRPGSKGKDSHHYLTKIMSAGRRETYTPGAGLYAPSKYMDEWKTAGTASLTGRLIDLDADTLDSKIAKEHEDDLDKAWWEAGNKGKRKTASKPAVKTDTMDGSHDTGTGTVFSNSDVTSQAVSTDPLLPPPKTKTSKTVSFPTLPGTIIPSSTIALTDRHPVPRARNYIGFEGTSPRRRTVNRRNRNCRLPNRIAAESHAKVHSKRRDQPWAKGVRKVGFGSSKYSYLSSCTKKSKHDIFHPYHVCTLPSVSVLPSISQVKRNIVRGKLTGAVSVIPTVFNPPLFLKCGPLLRYTGMRREPQATRPGQQKKQDKEIWRGSVMIVTDDKKSKYSTPPILALFVAPKTLLPPPPLHVDTATGELADEYIDPLAGHPKVGRDGRTLYVRPVEDLPEEKDLSTIETDAGIYERVPSSTSSQHTRSSQLTGEALGKAVSVKGFRLHVERGHTFWRFNIEIELLSTQQRIGYRINSGPVTAFFVPASTTPMNIMSYSCNGFSLSVDTDEFSGPDPLWRDVLNVHQTRPFHVMVGGGDQVYNDCVMRSTSIFAEWLTIKNPLHKHNAPFTAEMQDELEDFYLTRYAAWFSQGLFSLAGSVIPMVNIWDDHDIIDGFGSYPHHFMASPVFTGLGAIAYKYYLLFQHQSIQTETETSEPSWLLGAAPGPYIQEKSRSVFMDFGGGVKFLGLDCRTERSRSEILSEATYDGILDRLYAEISNSNTTHLLVLMGVPIAYPRLVWLENILTSRIMDPVKALSRAGAFGNLLNQFDGGVEILDDLDDHWTAKNHKAERRFLIQDLQDLAASKSVRISILSGDVHLAAVGQFYSNPKINASRSRSSGIGGAVKLLTKDKDHRYMPNITTSAIVNTPPPPLLADMLAKRDKIHHLDGSTDESMIPLFSTDVDGKKRNNKVLLPRRNWVSIRLYDPEASPPPSPTLPPAPATGFGGLVRRLSQRRDRPSFDGPADSRGSLDQGGGGSRPSLLSRPSQRRTDSFGPRPPISGGGMGLLRRLSSSRGRIPTARSYMDAEYPSTYSVDAGPAPAQPRARSKSLDFSAGVGGLLRRLSLSRTRSRNRGGKKKKPDSGGINGYGADSTEESLPYRGSRDDREGRGYDGRPRPQPRAGARYDEQYSDDEYESAPSPEIKRSRNPAAGPTQNVGIRGGGVDSRHYDGADEYYSPADVGRTSMQADRKGKGPERVNQSRGYRRESARDQEFYSDEDLTPASTSRGPPVPAKVPLGVGAGAQTTGLSRTSTLPTHPTAGTGTASNPAINALQRSDTSKSFHRSPTLQRTGTGLLGFGKPKTPEEPINLEGGLEVTINVEVNRRDPAGITVPYRLLVPALFHEEEGEVDEEGEGVPQNDGAYDDVVVDTLGVEGEGRGRLTKMPTNSSIPAGQGQGQGQGQLPAHGQQPQPGFLKRLLSLGGGRRRRESRSRLGSRSRSGSRSGSEHSWDSRNERAYRYQTGVERGHVEEREERRGGGGKGEGGKSGKNGRRGGMEESFYG